MRILKNRLVLELLGLHNLARKHIPGYISPEGSQPMETSQSVESSQSSQSSKDKSKLFDSNASRVLSMMQGTQKVPPPKVQVAKQDDFRERFKASQLARKRKAQQERQSGTETPNIDDEGFLLPSQADIPQFSQAKIGHFSQEKIPNFSQPSTPRPAQAKTSIFAESPNNFFSKSFNASGSFNFSQNSGVRSPKLASTPLNRPTPGFHDNDAGSPGNAPSTGRASPLLNLSSSMFGSQDIKQDPPEKEDGIDWDALIEEAEEEEEQISSQLAAINDSFNVFDQSQLCTPLPPADHRKRECPAVERRAGKVIGEKSNIFTLDGFGEEEDFDFHL